MNSELQIVQSVIDSLPTLYFLVASDGQIARWNRKSIDVTGYGPDELRRMNILDLYEGQDREHIALRMEEVFKRGESDAEASLITKGGRRIPYYFSGKCIHIEGQAYLSGLGIDISDRKAMEARLLRQATTDSLTGATSRGHFLEQAEAELVRAIRYGSSLSLLMLDLDHFKSINDTHGHQGGDVVLQEFVRLCRAVVRDVDLIGRMGGEEFAILLPETDGSGAYQLGERLRQSVAEHRMMLPDGTTLVFSTSIGVASLVSPDCRIDQLLRHADEALYAAKNSGRNRVSPGWGVVARPEYN